MTDQIVKQATTIVIDYERELDGWIVARAELAARAALIARDNA